VIADVARQPCSPAAALDDVERRALRERRAGEPAATAERVLPERRVVRVGQARDLYVAVEILGREMMERHEVARTPSTPFWPG
jgi:hypothetical protein